MKIDKRTKKYRTLHLWFNRYTRAAFVAGIIFGSLLGFSLKQQTRTSLEAPQAMITQVVAVEPFCRDVISCIRDVGEELGVSNQGIMTMIRIAKCESGYRADAMGINKNSTADRGVFQLNSIHKGISNADAFNYELNIRYAYKMFINQGTTPWNSSKRCWNK